MSQLTLAQVFNIQNLETIIQTEVKSELDKYCILTYIYIYIESRKKGLMTPSVRQQWKHRHREQAYGQGWGRGGGEGDEWTEEHGSIYTNIRTIDSQWEFAV